MQLNNALNNSHSPGFKRAVLDVDGPWLLYHGATLQRLKIAYTLYGNSDLPCVLVLGGISAGRDCAHQTSDYASGWWEQQIGFQQAIDLRHYCVLGIDYLGGNGESSRLPFTNDSIIPAIDTRDQARAIERLAHELNISAFDSVIGSSYGAMVGLALAEEFPRRVNKVLAISGAHQTSVQSSGIRHIQRQIVLQAKSEHSNRGLQLARALAMVTYRSSQELDSRFQATTQWSENNGYSSQVSDYLLARGAHFADQFSADAFCCLSQSIDLHRVDPLKIASRLTCVAVQQDQLIPQQQIEQLTQATGARLISISSAFGHDAFLKETQTIGWIIQQFLNEPTANESTQ